MSRIVIITKDIDSIENASFLLFNLYNLNIDTTIDLDNSSNIDDRINSYKNDNIKIIIANKKSYIYNDKIISIDEIIQL
jgi:hypothetical protein